VPLESKWQSPFSSFLPIPESDILIGKELKNEHCIYRWKNRRFTCDALVLPDAPDILLGAFPLEAMDLTINPQAEAEGFSRELVGVHGDIVMHRV